MLAKSVGVSLRRWILCWLMMAPSWVWCQEPSLTLDGIAIGMSYRQVLEQLGRPRSLNEEHGEIVFAYPSPPGRSGGTTVWFHKGQVFYVSGYTLKDGEETLFLPGMVGGILEDHFGQPAENLCEFGKWWPRSGVVLAGSNAIWPEKQLQTPLGLRSRDYPNLWSERSPGHLVSDYEPAIDDETMLWTVDDVSLGMAEERARELGPNLDLRCEGGFVRAIASPANAILSHQRDSQDLSLILDLGQAPMVFGQGLPLSPPDEGWMTLTPSGRIRLEQGKVAEIELEIHDDALFEALTTVGNQAGRSTSTRM